MDILVNQNLVYCKLQVRIHLNMILVVIMNYMVQHIVCYQNYLMHQLLMPKLRTYVVIHKLLVEKYLVRILNNSKIKHLWNFKQMIHYILKHNMIMEHNVESIHSHLLRNSLIKKHMMNIKVMIVIYYMVWRKKVLSKNFATTLTISMLETFIY